MADVIHFPVLVDKPVVQTRGPGRRPKSIPNIQRILFDRRLAAARHEAEQSHQALTRKTVLTHYVGHDRMVVQRQGDGTWRLEINGRYSDDVDLASQTLRQCASKIDSEFRGVGVVPPNVYPLETEVRHG